MDTEITLHALDGLQGSGDHALLSIVERAKTFVSRDYVHSVRRAETQITLLRTRAIKWTVPHNFFDNRQTIEQLTRLQIIIQEEILKAKTTSKGSEFERPEWKGFLEYTLNDQQLADADTWKLTPAALWEGVNTLTLDGYRLTLSYSAKLQAYTATLQAGKEQKIAAGWSLSARDEKAEGALKLLMYKHFSALDGDWSQLIETPVRAKRG